MKLLLSIFKFFASLRVAVTLLVLLGISFAAGTFIESYYGTEAAQVVVYRTRWMAALLILLGLNLLASALDRIPWKLKHVGFLTTHLGIILILSGSLISQAFGIEGQLAIQEGKTGSRITLSEPLIQIFSVDSDQKWIYSLKRRPFSWKGREKLSAEPSPIEAHLLIDYPKAKLNEIVETLDTGSPALHFSLSGSRASIDQWLFLEDPSRQTVNLGPATVQFTKEPIQRKDKYKTTPELGTLKLNFESGQSHEIDLDLKSIGKIFPIKGTPFEVQVNRILKDAIVDGNQLIERSEVSGTQQTTASVRNPAAELTLTGNGLSEQHILFARFPEFPTLHGMKPSEAHVRISYEVPGLEAESAKNELRFIWQENQLPRFQIQAGKTLTDGNLELGKEIQTGWMDFKFKADQYYEHAQVRKNFSPLPSSSQSIEAIPVILIEFSTPDEQKTLWLEQGEIKHMAVGGSDYHVLYGLKTKPLGFQIELQDFMIETDPGTDKPASFKSRVKLKDASMGIERDQLIQMNEPLKHRGFKVYQSAYQQTPGEPDVSIFTVARDPGNGLKYTGAIIMIAGIGMLFYVKSLSTLRGSDPKLRSK